MIHRREIDGLRAFAVLPVILFHAELGAFSGGYVGVDVFFVISGYLITSIILADLEAGRFSIAGFYERRIRRIGPALTVMLIVTAVLSGVLLLPSYAKLVSDSLVAAAFFASNILYAHGTGYFGEPERFRPLLHTWTLGVEEQFYVLYPLFMALAWKLGRRRLLVILSLLTALSLAFAEVTALDSKAWGFFLLPGRGWELGIGGLAAMYLALRPHADWPRRRREALSIVGLALIAYGVFTFDETTPFTAMLTIPPVVGTTLVILCAAPDTLPGRVLGMRVFVAIGLASYSLYLWHQPILVFSRHLLRLPPSGAMLLLEFVAIGVAGYLSWRFVERPFRDRTRFDRRQVFHMALAAFAVLLALGMIGRATEGTFGLNPRVAEAKTLEARFVFHAGLGQECVDGLSASPGCRTSDQPEVLVWGDSFAAQLVAGLRVSRPDVRMEQATKYVCGPLLGIAPYHGSYDRDWASGCIRNNDAVLVHLKNSPSIRYVMMGVMLSSYFDPHWQAMSRDGHLSKSQALVLASFRNTVRQILALGIEPVLFAPPPRNGVDLGPCTERAAYYGLSATPCNFPLSQAKKAQALELALLGQLEADVRIVRLSDAICPDGLCRPRIGGTFIYLDDGHLTDEGSRYLGGKLDFYRLLTARAPQ